MNLTFLESVPISIVFLGVAIYMLASCEIGFQFGERDRKARDKEATTSLGPMVGGLLGMLAFMLAFTFSMVVSQHELRKQNVLDEANIIGTAYLRAELLDEKLSLEVNSCCENMWMSDYRPQAAAT